jgi:ABC-type branched-subunit amino acid transport system permease subunit
MFDAHLLTSVLVQLPLVGAAYLALAAGELLTTFGVLMFVGALVATTDLPAPVAIVFASIGGGVAGVGFGCITRRLRGLSFAVIGICVAEIARYAFTASSWSGLALGLQAPPGASTALPFWLKGLVAAAAVVSVIALDRTAWRRQLRLAVFDESAARALGVDVDRLLVGVSGAIGMLSGAAGALYLREFAIFEPRLLGFDFGVSVLALALVSGARSAPSALTWGAGVLGITDLLLRVPAWRGVVFGILVTLAAMRLAMTKARASSAAQR